MDILVEYLPLIRHAFTGLSGTRALIAAQIHGRNGIDVLLPRLNALVTEGWHLHQLLVQLLPCSSFRAPEDVITRQIVLQIRSPGEIDKRLLPDAGEDRLQADRLRRGIDIAGKDLDRL